MVFVEAVEQAAGTIIEIMVPTSNPRSSALSQNSGGFSKTFSTAGSRKTELGHTGICKQCRYRHSASFDMLGFSVWMWK